MVRAVIASILAVALLSLPAGVRHDLICQGPALAAPAMHDRHDHSHDHEHGKDEPRDHHNHGCDCAIQAMSSYGMGTLSLAGLAVICAAAPPLAPAQPVLQAPEPARRAFTPFRPPGRTRLALNSTFRI